MNEWIEIIFDIIPLFLLGFFLGKITRVLEEIEHNTRMKDNK